MADFFNQNSPSCEFEIKGDKLKYPDSHEEDIVSGLFAAHNRQNYYDGIANSQFAKTKVPIRMYKKTIIKKDGKIIDVLTEIIVPPQTEIYFGNCDKIRISQGIVGKQVEIEYNEGIASETNKKADYCMSIHAYARNNSDFKYITGQLIKPIGEFYSYEDWVKLYYKPDATCESGIHVYNDQYQAMKYNSLILAMLI